MTRETADHGKWSEAGVPHRGWREIECFDLGEDHWMTCEMCESTEIRHVHIVEHTDYRSLRVGRVCAGHLTGDYVGVERRERAVKNRSARRATWTVPEKWRAVDRGCYITRTTKGWRIIIQEVDGRFWWQALEKRTRTCHQGFSDDVTLAALAAFDAAWPR